MIAFLIALIFVIAVVVCMSIATKPIADSFDLESVEEWEAFNNAIGGGK